MKIDIEKLAKEVFKDKKLIIRNTNKDRISINYVANRGNGNRKSFIFPKEIIIDDRLIEAIALFLGDGDPHRKEKTHLAFTSKDKELMQFFLNFLRERFILNDKDITFTVQYTKSNKNMQSEWANILKLKGIHLKKSNRHKEEAGQLQVNGIVFRKIFEGIIQEILTTNFLEKDNLRKAFLRGLFAAEGNIGIDYQDKHYISQIRYCLSIYEQKLGKMIRKALNHEKISSSVCESMTDHSLNINITNWENYLKLWNIKVFDLCTRKKQQFEYIAKNLNIYFRFEDNFLKNFFSSIPLLQREIAIKIKSWQANVCRTITGTHLLRIEQLLILIPYSDYTLQQVIRNVVYVRIGFLTKLKITPTILNFLKEFKSI